MEYNYALDHMFDLLNESDILDVQEITRLPEGYRIEVHDGTEFILILQLGKGKE